MKTKQIRMWAIDDLNLKEIKDMFAVLYPVEEYGEPETAFIINKALNSLIDSMLLAADEYELQKLRSIRKKYDEKKQLLV